MSFFFGGGDTVEPTHYNSLQLQSSTQGIPIPIIYGQTKVAGNLIWYGNFQAIRHEQSVGKGGGATAISYTYTCGVMLGMCEGVVSDYNQVWMNQGVTTVNALGFNEFYGTDTQTPWGFLTTNYPDQALAYQGIAYLAQSALDLGSSPYLPQMWIEVKSNLANSAVTSNDADPALVVQDILQNVTYGALFPTSMIDMNSLIYNANSYQKYCGALGLGFSASISNAKPTREYITSWLDVTNTAAVWSGDVLKFIPFGDKTTTANGVTFTPNNSIAYDLTDNDFQTEAGADPIVIVRSDPHDAYNHWRLQVRDKTNQYNVAVVEVKDQSSIEAIGLRSANIVDATFLSSPTMGLMCAELMKNRHLYIRNHFTFKLGVEYALLEAMDIVTLTQSDTGLDHFPVRITQITENDNGLMEIEAEEFIEGCQWSVQYPAQTNIGSGNNTLSAATDTYQPVIFEPTYAMLNGNSPQIWLAANGDPATWGGAVIWVSLDGGTSYSSIGIINAGCKVGHLTAILPSSTSTYDTTHTLAVDISQGGGSLLTVSGSEAASAISLCYVDGEFISYTNSTLTGTGKYNLINLYRGWYGSTKSTHGIGTPFARLDDTIFKYNLPVQSYAGTTIYLKFTSFNIYGNSHQDLSSVVAYPYTISEIGNQQSTVIQTSVSGKPAAAQEILTNIAYFNFTIAANLAATIVSIGTNPTSTAVFNIQKNGSNFATITISTSGVVTLSGSATSFVANDILKIIAPATQDATLANIAINLAITKT